MIQLGSSFRQTFLAPTLWRTFCRRCPLLSQLVGGQLSPAAHVHAHRRNPPQRSPIASTPNPPTARLPHPPPHPPSSIKRSCPPPTPSHVALGGATPPRPCRARSLPSSARASVLSHPRPMRASNSRPPCGCGRTSWPQARRPF